MTGARMNKLPSTAPSKQKREILSYQTLIKRDRTKKIPETTMLLPIFIVAFENIYIATDVQRNISRSSQTSEFFHNQSRSLTRQDCNEVSLENYRITSECSEVTESTNKPSKESHAACRLNHRENTWKERAALQQWPRSVIRGDKI